MEIKKLLPYFGILLLVLFLSYFSSLDHPFTYLDDQEQVVQNEAIRSLDLDHLKAIFTGTSVGMYQPLTTLIYALTYQLAELNSTAYHLASLWFHALNCLLLILLLKRLQIGNWSSLLLCGIFAMHPMQVESVAWVSAFSNLVFTSFYLLSLIAYLKFLNGKSSAYWLAIFFFILSCFSKATAVSLPIVLLLFDRWHAGKWSWKLLINKIPFLAVSVVFGLITINSREAAGHLSDLSQSFEWHHRIFLIADSIFFYLMKFVSPLGLSAFYPYPELNEGLFDLVIYLSLPIVIFFAWLIYRYRQHKELLIGALFFLITLAPTLQFIPVGNQITTDRYIYLPMIGLLIMLSLALQSYQAQVKKIVSGVLILGLGYLTYNRSQVWRSDKAIWTDVLEKYPKVAQAHNNLGSYLLLEGKKQEAFKHFDKAIELKPYYADAYNNRGNLYSQAGKDKAAMADFNQALKLRPHADAYFNRANQLSKNGNLDLAIEDYGKSLALKRSPDAYTNRGFAYLQKANFPAARKDLKKALEHDPAYHPAYFLLAMEARERNDFEEACNYLKLAAKYGNAKAAAAIPELCGNIFP